MNILQDWLGVDAARVASAVSMTAESFHAIGGWNTVGPACAFALVCGSLFIWKREYLSKLFEFGTLRRWRERRRMNSKRRKEVNELIADTITDAVEDLYYKKELSHEERMNIYNRLGKFYPDLKRRGKRSLIEEIEARRAKEKRDSEGKVVPLPLPKEEVAPAKKTARTAHVHVL